MPIPTNILPAPEPFATLLLQGVKCTGKLTNEALGPIEEQLTESDLTLAQQFLAWLRHHNLTIGHGTITLRWDEFVQKRAPVSKDAAYCWAVKQAEVYKPKPVVPLVFKKNMRAKHITWQKPPTPSSTN